MGTKWTEEQQQVIDARNCDLLVSAAAGSGKTAVLVERIIQRILDSVHPVDIDRMLVVTFTKAAAAEMRSRVLSAIEKQLELDGNNEHLLRQATLVHNAQITTIDSFCLFVIRNHFHEIDLSPDFRIANTGELTLLKEEAIEELLQEEYELARNEFIAFMNNYAKEGKEDSVIDMIKDLANRADSFPWPKEWIASLREDFEVKDLQSFLLRPWMTFFFEYCREQIQDVKKQLEELLKLAKLPGVADKVQGVLYSDIDCCIELLSAGTMEELQQQFADMSITRFCNTSGATDKDTTESIKDKRKECVDVIKNMKQKYFQIPMEEHFRMQRRMLPDVTELCYLTEKYLDLVAEKKQNKSLLDFGDLGHFALNILVDPVTKEPTMVAKEYQEYFEEVMTDEYQDSNFIQEAILQSIAKVNSGKRNRFIVGDIKQSIYGFRLACPEIFMEKYESFKKEGEQRKIILRKNFRSREEVLDFTNDICRPLMQKELGGVSYDEDAALYLGATDYPQDSGLYQPEVLITTIDEELAKEKKDMLVYEAKMVANRMKELKKSMRVTGINPQGEKVLRPVNYRDMVILVRSPKSIGAIFYDVLKEQGIPVYMEAEAGYFDNYEIKIMMELLRVLDNPYQDISLVSVLTSPMFRFTEEELIPFQPKEETETFAKNFFKYGKEHPDHNKINAVITFLEQVRKRLHDTPIHQVLEYIYGTTSLYEIIGAMPNGANRIANLERLLQEAIAYEASSYHGCFQFVDYLNHLQKFSVDYGSAEIASDQDDVVRIMSIHKSKGLEFPIVFLSGMGCSFNTSDSKKTLMIHSDYGMAFCRNDSRKNVRYPSYQREVLGKANMLKALGEELRVLYVGMTRAKEKLVVTGYCKEKKEKDKDKDIKRPMKMQTTLTFLDKVSAKCYLDWILKALKLCPERKEQIHWIDGKELVAKEVVDVLSVLERKRKYQRVKEEFLPEEIQQLKERVLYQYPYKTQTQFKVKYSVSEIKHVYIQESFQKQGEEAEPLWAQTDYQKRIPNFMLEDGKEKEAEVSQGALRGTATHRYLECFDFTKDNFETTFEIQLATMQQEQRIFDWEVELLEKEKIEGFLTTNLAYRISCAAKKKQYYAEKAFVMGYTTEEMKTILGEAQEELPMNSEHQKESSNSILKKETERENDLVLVQGIIDVYFVEEDGFVVLDYKTDSVKTKEELVQRYAAQIELYANAIQRATGIPCKEAFLYSFSLGTTVAVPLKS